MGHRFCYSLYLLTETFYITIFIFGDPVKNTNTEIIVGIFLYIVVDDLRLFLWAKIMIIILFHHYSGKVIFINKKISICEQAGVFSSIKQRREILTSL